MNSRRWRGAEGFEGRHDRGDGAMTLDERDPIVMADTGPLIRLAAAGLLDGLRATNRRVVIVDRVEAEATQDRSKPSRRKSPNGLRASADSIARPRTVIGAGIEKLESEQSTPEQQRLLKAALRNSAKRAIRDFSGRVGTSDRMVRLVVYEDEDVPFALQATRIPLMLMTTPRIAETTRRVGNQCRRGCRNRGSRQDVHDQNRQ
jgi:hypothetical protein